MDIACLALYKARAYIDCLLSIGVVPTLQISNPVFDRNHFPKLPQTLGIIPEELRCYDSIDVTVAKNVEIIYDFKFGVIELKNATQFYSFPIECVLQIKASDMVFELHTEPAFIHAKDVPNLRLVSV